uniref:Uncharacterized protein n=1 Tax=Noccaea caerulescens TaxID=107243 RepID=A0A1J3GFA3_NOCCA
MSLNKRKQLCGAENRMKKKKKDEEAKSLKGTIFRYFAKSETLDSSAENSDKQHATFREDEVDEKNYILELWFSLLVSFYCFFFFMTIIFHIIRFFL